MHEMGLAHTAKFTKSAKIVGEVMGKFHPHGDAPIYDALVRLAQDFSMRYPLIWGQGNFGSIDGDPPAHMRYTEAKMSAITTEMLIDIDKETVEFAPNFDGSENEPIYLPAKLPNLLLMGSEGIAVGMATKIPPHNLGEVIDAILFMISKVKFEVGNETLDVRGLKLDKEVGNLKLDNQTSNVKLQNQTSNFQHLTSDVTIDNLLEFIKGPDFPTAGAIYDMTEIKNVYITGRGKVVIRGKAEIEDIGQGKSSITVSELPYQVNKAQLIARIADLAKEKKIEGISDLRDESDRRGLHIYIELKRDASPKKY